MTTPRALPRLLAAPLTAPLTATLTATLLLHAAPARAQIVNVEQSSISAPTPGWSGALQAGVSLSRGNTVFTDLTGGGHIQWQSIHKRRPDEPADAPPHLRHRVRLLGSTRYAFNAEGTYINRHFSHLRWTAMWWRRLGHETFAQLQTDSFQRLRYRLLLGALGRATALDLPRVRLAVTAGPMFEAERAQDADAPTPTDRMTARLNAALLLHVVLEKNRLVFHQSCYAQPRLTAPSDARLLSASELLVQLSRRLTLSLSLSIAHDTRPPVGVERTDTNLTQSLKLAF